MSHNWQSLELELQQLQLVKPTVQLKEKCLTPPPSESQKSYISHFIVAAVVFIVASWSSYKDMTIRSYFNSTTENHDVYMSYHNFSLDSLLKKKPQYIVPSVKKYNVWQSQSQWLRH